MIKKKKNRKANLHNPEIIYLKKKLNLSFIYTQMNITKILPLQCFYATKLIPNKTTIVLHVIFVHREYLKCSARSCCHKDHKFLWS